MPNLKRFIDQGLYTNQFQYTLSKPELFAEEKNNGDTKLQQHNIDIKWIKLMLK